MTTCVISQPRLFPGMHYLDRMLQADVFVVFDVVQFNPRHEENRFRVRGTSGPEWVTASVDKGPRERAIRDVRLSKDMPWIDGCKNALERHYGKAPHYRERIAEVHDALDGGHESLVGLDMASWQPALRALRPSCEFVLASNLKSDGKGPELLLDLCREVGADVYLSGGFGREYLDQALFTDAGVEVRFHEYAPDPYPQRGAEFVPFLSYLDRMFEAGFAAVAVE